MFGRTPEKYEAKALEYERKNNTRKSMKYREKAARLRARNGGLPATQTTGINSTIPLTQRTPAIYETNALKWEQRGNWTKAQKNREKAWRLNNPQYANAAAPAFYQNNRFVGYNVPVSGLPITQQTTYVQQTGFAQPLGVAPLGMAPLGAAPLTGNPLNKVGPSRNPDVLEQKALAYQNRGKTKKALKYQQKAARLRAHRGTGAVGQPWVARTPAIYETNALKWEQRGNWTKAQKNREKVWRLQNPQYLNTPAPLFYQKNVFQGYNLPVATGTTTTFGAPIVEQVVRPTIVEQTTRAERIVEVQPIIHREIEAPQIKVIEKHLYETVPSAGPHTITNAAIVQETVRPKIIEEVQPVVHREVPAPFVERVEQHVTEHIVKPTVTTKEVLNAAPVMGVAAGGPINTQTNPGLLGQGNLRH